MRTRLVMAGAFVGALAVLSGSMLFSWPVSVKGTADTATEEAAEAFDSPPGTCLDWPHDKPQNMRRVSCDREHIFEVTKIIEIDGQYGPNAKPPAEAAWQQIVTEKCTAEAATYLGGTLDPFGKYTAGALKPSSEQWSNGDRRLRCGVQRVTPSGTRLMPTTGAADDQDQSNVNDPGTCFALVDGQVGDPVKCEQAHAYEVVGVVDLTTVFPKGYPAEAQQREKLVDLCPPVAAKYTGNANLQQKKLSLYSDTLKAESWAAGSRRVNCKVGARESNGALRAVRGSVAAAPAPPSSAKPSGSSTPSSSAPSSSAGG